MNSISVVEYFSIATLITATSQFDIKVVIMAKNSSQLKLVYSSPLLQSLLVNKYRISGNLMEANELIYSTAIMSNNDLLWLLSLFKKTNNISITSAL